MLRWSASLTTTLASSPAVMRAIVAPFSHSRPGLGLRQAGLSPKYPVLIIPGFVTSGLELWGAESCANHQLRCVPEKESSNKFHGGFVIGKALQQRSGEWMLAVLHGEQACWLHLMQSYRPRCACTYGTKACTILMLLCFCCSSLLCNERFPPCSCPVLGYVEIPVTSPVSPVILRG